MPTQRTYISSTSPCTTPPPQNKNSFSFARPFSKPAHAFSRCNLTTGLLRFPSTYRSIQAVPCAPPLTRGLPLQTVACHANARCQHFPRVFCPLELTGVLCTTGMHHRRAARPAHHPRRLARPQGAEQRRVLGALRQPRTGEVCSSANVRVVSCIYYFTFTFAVSLSLFEYVCYSRFLPSFCDFVLRLLILVSHPVPNSLSIFSPSLSVSRPLGG